MPYGPSILNTEQSWEKIKGVSLVTPGSTTYVLANR